MKISELNKPFLQIYLRYSLIANFHEESVSKEAAKQELFKAQKEEAGHECFYLLNVKEMLNRLHLISEIKKTKKNNLKSKLGI